MSAIIATAERGAAVCVAPEEENPFTVAEYFAGIGLFRMGLEAAGWRVVYGNDWSEERAQIYRGFFGDSYRVEDIFSVSTDDVPRTTLATCSFPCTDLSLAGKLEGINGNQSGAFWGFCDILANQGADAPPIVLLENVVGWLHSNGGADFRATAKALNNLGYACDAFMLNALSFVPQSRPRIFMVGVKTRRESGGGPLFPDSRSKRLMPDRLKKLMQGKRGYSLDAPSRPGAAGLYVGRIFTLHRGAHPARRFPLVDAPRG